VFASVYRSHARGRTVRVVKTVGVIVLRVFKWKPKVKVNPLQSRKVVEFSS
jgi:hypothetical protein